MRNASSLLRCLSIFLSFALCALPIFSGEPEQAQPYEKVRYPDFENGRLKTVLEAEQAEIYDLAEGEPRIVLRKVIITIYDHSEASLASTPEGEPLPVKTIITSDRGYFTRRPAPNGKVEEIANLEGNVVLKAMRVPLPPPTTAPSLRPRRLDPAVETEIHCQHAQWNNTQRKLNGDGEVHFMQEDSQIIGTGFLYLADDDAPEKSGGGGTPNIRDWGGIIFIEHDARMEIDRFDENGKKTQTIITCEDTASYKLREREIQFEKNVRVERPDLRIDSDILKVFLRQQDEVKTDAEGKESADTLHAGQVKNIIATIGTRGGDVVITGFDENAVGGPSIQYIAKGGRADYNMDSNRIIITDSRQGRLSRVEFDRDKIEDVNLDFQFTRTMDENGREANVLDTLIGNGGQGRVVLHPKPDGSGVAEVTEVDYGREMTYSRADGRIRFLGAVSLRQEKMRIRSEILEFKMDPGKSPNALSSRINSIFAESGVHLQSATHEGRAERAEYFMNHQTGIDTLRLFGPPQRTPPDPWIKDNDSGNQITAPEIHMQRLSRSRTGQKDRHLIQGLGGVSVCDLVNRPENEGDRPKIISIKCEEGMEYNEATQKARFEAGVIVTSDSPEDSYVLTSDRLIVNLVEEPRPGVPGETNARLRRIHASGNSRLMQDHRICEASEIIRDLPSSNPDEGEIYLEGAQAKDGYPPKMATYKEMNGAELGSMFAAPRIMSSARGDLIRANGPGQLSMPDEIRDPEQLFAGGAMQESRSSIHFGGAARYESDGIRSEAKFRVNVVLTQPSRGLVINSEELDSWFVQDQIVAGAAPDELGIERIGRITKAEARVNVKIENRLPRGGKRVARGDKGVIVFEPTGNIINLSADRSQDKRRFAMAMDHDGLAIRAPDIEVRENQGYTRASGPGDLQIPGNRSGEGLSKVPTRVQWGEKGQMIYNEVALNIRANGNVHVRQPNGNNWQSPSLDGRSNEMEITLLEPPVGGGSGQDAMAQVSRLDARGGVLLRVFADPPPENPNIDWLNRPGTTFFTRGDFGVYDAQRGEITVSSLPGRQPQLLLNVVDTGRPAQRQRFKADRFILNTNTTPRRWRFEGQLESNNLRDGEPFEFVD